MEWWAYAICALMVWMAGYFAGRGIGEASAMAKLQGLSAMQKLQGLSPEVIQGMLQRGIVQQTKGN